MKIIATPKELQELGIWDEIVEHNGINPWALNEGLMYNDTEYSFDVPEKLKID